LIPFILVLLALIVTLLHTAALRKSKLGRLFILFLSLMSGMMLLELLTDVRIFGHLAFVFLCHVAAVIGIVLFSRLFRR